MPELAYVEGNIISIEAVRIPATDSGFGLGYGVFETLRGYDGHLFRLDNHLQRLKSGAAFLGIELDTAEIGPATIATLEKSHLAVARVRISVTTSVVQLSSVIITVERYQPPSEEDYRIGLAASIASILRHKTSRIHRYKTLNQLENLLAKQEVEKRGNAEAIFLNELDNVIETNRGNIFIVGDGVVKTPSLDNDLLPGITRGVVLELASCLGIPIEETDIAINELDLAEEVFITSSMVEIMPLTRIDHRVIGDGKIGRLTEYLRTNYKERVLQEIAAVR